MWLPVFFIFLTRLDWSLSQANRHFVDYFSKCNAGTPEFDNCIKHALNGARIFFKTGVPEFSIPPFDPFFAEEVVQRRGGNSFYYELKLKNVEESGWTNSVVTKFRSNRNKNLVQYTQFFPDKYLKGLYEFQFTIMNNTMRNRGIWNLTLYDLTQTTTIVGANGSKRLKVNVDVEKIGNLDLHISNLLRGRTAMETVLDRIINRMWQPGFSVIRPLINDLVSTAFTKIFTDAFQNFDISNVIN